MHTWHTVHTADKADWSHLPTVGNRMTSEISRCSLVCASRSPRPRRELRRWACSDSGFCAAGGRCSGGLGGPSSSNPSKMRCLTQSSTSSRGISGSPGQASDSSNALRVSRHRAERRALERVLCICMLSLYPLWVYSMSGCLGCPPLT